MVLVGPRPLPVSGHFVALFGGHAAAWLGHAAAWLGHAAALKEFWDFENLGLGI